MKKIFIIAGEASGDWMGAKLIRELKALQPDTEFSGIGGPKMEAEGFRSIFPMQQISLIGIAELLPHIIKLKRLMNQTEKTIIDTKPDILVTIDSPGFNFRIAERETIQDMRPAMRMVHYVAPTVWAYKPHRAEWVNRLFDKLLCILPFEPQYFYNAEFIGHPVLEDGLDKGDAAAFRQRHNITEDFICLMPGSRKGEVRHMLPVFLSAAKILGKKPVVIAADNIIIPDGVTIVHNREKLDCFAASSMGIIKSGTSGLEYAFSGKPYVVAYKANPISVWMVRRMIKIQFANLVNILFGREIVPELLQEKCTPEHIAAALSSTIKVDKDALIEKLSSNRGIAPSKLAASIILS